MSLTQRNRANIIANCYKEWDIYGKKVLDVGCGNGVVSEVLKEKFNLDLYGTDIIDYRKVNIPFRKIENNYKLPFDDLSFDYVMFNDVLHHIEYIETFILEGSRVAKNLLVFEDKPSFLLKVFDIILNYFYSAKMPRPMNFKFPDEWCLLFNRLGFQYELGEASYPLWYPFRHILFKLVKRKQNTIG